MQFIKTSAVPVGSMDFSHVPVPLLSVNKVVFLQFDMEQTDMEERA